MSGTGGNGARTNGALGDNLGGSNFVDPALLSPHDIRDQTGDSQSLILDGNKNWNLSPGNGWEGGAAVSSGIDACCRFMQTTCPTPLPSSAPTSPPRPSPREPRRGCRRRGRRTRATPRPC